MRFVPVAAAALLCLASTTSAFARSGPSELPPASYTGQQYVDSRGCVFLRAGYGGQVQWVQRISSNRQPLCGYPPTFAAVSIEMADETGQAPAAPVVVAQQTVVAAPAPRVQPAQVQPVRVAVQPTPQVAAPRQPVQVAAAASGPGPGKIGCYKSAPVAMVVPLRGGGTAVVCTKGDGTMNGWRPPIYPQGAPVGASLNLPQLAGYHMTGNGDLVLAGAAPVIPEGYRAVFEDDRLNLARGLGTASGRADQNQVWSEQVPAQQVATLPAAKAKSAKTKTTVSTNTNAAAAPGSYYVQVGTFGVPENASGAASRLSALGFPTAKGNLNKNGKALQIVYAGPFGTAAEAQSALSAARSAGFSDAFIR